MRRAGLFCLRLRLFTYGWSSLLTVIWLGLFTVENRFGLFYFRFPPSGNWVWSFLLTVPPRPEIGFGRFFYLRFPHCK